MTEQKSAPASALFFLQTALILGLILIFALAWLWLDTRQRFSEIEQSLAQRLEKSAVSNQQSQAVSKLADERSQEAMAKITLIEQKMAEFRGQQQAMQTLFLELANNREERIVTEAEQLINIANQQLQLAGNVKPALLALQTADSRLQELDAPLAIQLRKAIARDLQKLQNLPLVDTSGISIQLENLAGNINQLPLVSSRIAKSILAPVPDASLNQWQQLTREVWQEMKSLIVLEHIDRPEPPLLAPEQRFFLRETIKLRLLTARVALLQHDQATYRRDLAAAEQWLKNHFDTRDSATKSALKAIHALAADNIVINVPDVSESLRLVSKYKLMLARS